jgi:hypothetical protein
LIFTWFAAALLAVSAALGVYAAQSLTAAFNDMVAVFPATDSDVATGIWSFMCCGRRPSGAITRGAQQFLVRSGTSPN